MNTRAAVEIVRDALSLLGWQGGVATVTATEMVTQIGHQRARAWVERTCPGCEHSPDDCPFLPNDQPATRAFHRNQVIFDPGTVCHAHQPAE